jgi:hypothetical protein
MRQLAPLRPETALGVRARKAVLHFIMSVNLGCLQAFQTEFGFQFRK